MKNNKMIIAIAAILCVLAAVTLMIKNNTAGKVAESTNVIESGNKKTENSDVQTIGKDNKLVINKSDISEKATFYPINVDGTRMEVLAVKDSSGNIRTAFNTCQVCYSSGKGYYVQSGNVLVCQNCRNRFTVDEVEVQSGGCNPWPIFSENKTVNEDTIEISYEYLEQSKKLFANWKK